MNERIKELLKQSGAYDHYEIMEGLRSDEKPIEKFAQLIVQECCALIAPSQEHSDDASLPYIGGAEGVELLHGSVRLIKEHFGVEEGVHMHPLHTPEKVRRIWNNDDTLNRGTGRSTILALQYITMALANPGTEFKIVDHHPTHEAARYLRGTIQAMVGRLGFKHFIFKETSIQFGE